MEFTNYYYFFFNGDIATVQSIVGTPPPHPTPFSAEGVEPPSGFSKRAGLDKTSTFRGGCLERRGDFFQGGYNFHIKNKI